MHCRRVLTCLLAAATLLAQPNPTLDFLKDQTDGQGLREMLPQWLKQQVQARRAARTAGTPEFRARFVELLGGLPGRTPLNARTVGVLDRDGYRVEKVIFESQPGFHVTANLYLPLSGKPPFPAILFPLGHEPGAKAHSVWQQILGTFARRGYVALAWDTLGQGERIQIYDEAWGDSKAASSTVEHTVLGIQTLLAGDALARYTIWDGVRALDYLLSRPEVDKSRVGLTGNSGGGTHTAYLGAVDDRFHVAAPSCFLTTWQRLLDTIGPQDAEQCIPGFLGAGFDHADFVKSFSPKPYLMLSAIRDFFSIQGARETFANGKDHYASAGAAGKLAMAETDDGHGYTVNLRAASYAWFARWLKTAAPPAEEAPVIPAQDYELRCTKTGQVATEFRGQTVATLNRERVKALRETSKATRESVRRAMEWRESSAAPAVAPYGEFRSGDLRVEKLVYTSEPGIALPAVVAYQSPGGGRRPAVLLVSARGKSAMWEQIQLLARRGAVVMAIDARGLGETRPEAATKGGSWNNWFGDFDSAMTAVMLGRSIVGMRAGDIERAYALLAARPDVDPRKIYGAGQGNAAPPLLHAAACGLAFAGLLLDGMVVSYQSVVDGSLHRGIFESLVPGALKSYDLPELAALAAPAKVLLVDAVSPVGAALPASRVQAAYAAAANAEVLRRVPDEPAALAYTRLLN